MRIIPITSLLLGCAAALSGCWVKKTACRGLHSALGSSCADDSSTDSSGDEPTGGVSGASAQPDDGTSGFVAVAPVTEVSETVVGQGFALTRVTPEQLSNNLIATVNFGGDANEFRYDDQYAGQTIDYLQILFGVPLGGVDFETATKRDLSTKAQTLLVSRVVASEIAAAATWKEWNKAANARVLFTQCDMGVDRPFMDADASQSQTDQDAVHAGEARWNKQVDEFFWRFYSRPPSDAERGAVKTAFLEALKNEGYPQAGWITVLYALLSTEEFWHI